MFRWQLPPDYKKEQTNEDRQDFFSQNIYE